MTEASVSVCLKAATALHNVYKLINVSLESVRKDF